MSACNWCGKKFRLFEPRTTVKYSWARRYYHIHCNRTKEAHVRMVEKLIGDVNAG